MGPRKPPRLSSQTQGALKSHPGSSNHIRDHYAPGSQITSQALKSHPKISNHAPRIQIIPQALKSRLRLPDDAQGFQIPRRALKSSLGSQINIMVNVFPFFDLITPGPFVMKNKKQMNDKESAAKKGPGARGATDASYCKPTGPKWYV